MTPNTDPTMLANQTPISVAESDTRQCRGRRRVRMPLHPTPASLHHPPGHLRRMKRSGSRRSVCSPTTPQQQRPPSTPSQQPPTPNGDHGPNRDLPDRHRSPAPVHAVSAQPAPASPGLVLPRYAPDRSSPGRPTSAATTHPPDPGTTLPPVTTPRHPASCSTPTNLPTRPGCRPQGEVPEDLHSLR